ncbi:MAG: class I SAM-dependent methyltransferase [Terriglobales bacterium]
MVRIVISREGIYLRSGMLARAVSRCSRAFGKGEVEIHKLLMGGEFGRPAASYARITGDLRRPSRPIAESPHAALLRDYQAEGEALFSPARFAATAYYRNAARCIETFGSYFDAKEPKDAVRKATRFCGMLDGRPPEAQGEHENAPGSLPVVRRIRFSDCYEIIHGQHRLAVAATRGLKSQRCVIQVYEPVVTPLQQLVMDSSWTQGTLELYQPIRSPELATWPVVRRCSDRLQMMIRWLEARGIRGGSYLDVGCSYGWFVAEMAELGFKASGVDRDAAALAVGRLVFEQGAAAYTASDLVSFLETAKRKYDVVSCFSVLHHFALGKMRVSAESLIRSIDAATGRVLFFDTAESHEGWFSKSLPSWDAQFIRKWLADHTSFSRVEPIGVDEDNAGSYRGQYGRHLFACSRE